PASSTSRHHLLSSQDPHRGAHSFPTRRSSDLVGETVEAKITAIDFDKKRVSLSMRALLPEDEQAPVKEAAEETVEETVETTEERSEEHTSELQSRFDLVCRLLLEKKK